MNSLKKYFVLLLVVLVCLVSCSKKAETNTVAEPTVSSEVKTEVTEAVKEVVNEVAKAAGTVEEVRGVTIPSFSVKVCGVNITNDDMVAYPIYKCTADTVNSSGTAKSNVFIGFKFSDVLDACGITGTFGEVKAVASDGYEVKFDGDILDEKCFLAINRDGSQFKTSPWFAPCQSGTTGDFLQDLVKVEIVGANVPTDRIAKDFLKKAVSVAETLLGFNEPVVEDKTDRITFAPYSFKINGKTVTNADLEGLHIYRITVTAANNKGAISESKYSGYVLKEVLKKLGIDSPKEVKAIANDGYVSELSLDDINSDITIIAIEKDKATSSDGSVWIAPCNQTVTSKYGRGIVEFTAK